MPPLVQAQEEEMAPPSSLQSKRGLSGEHWRSQEGLAAAQAGPAAAGGRVAARQAARRAVPRRRRLAGAICDGERWEYCK